MSRAFGAFGPDTQIRLTTLPPYGLLNSYPTDSVMLVIRYTFPRVSSTLSPLITSKSWCFCFIELSFIFKHK